MAQEVPQILLKNGHKIPAVGLGTSFLRDPQTIVEIAIDNGYRLLDGAFLYRTEVQVGNAIQNKIREGVIKREDMFIISKLWRTMHDPKDVRKAMERSLKDLRLKYVDAYLMHSPLPSKLAETAIDEYDLLNLEEADIPLEDTWKAMEKLVNIGYAKSIGVSDFNSKQIDRIAKDGNYFPVINELEVNPFFNQQPLLEYCEKNKIQVVAYAPFYSPGHPLLDDDVPSLVDQPIIVELAEKHKKTPGQIIIRYLYQLGCIPVPKPDFIEQVKENISIFGDWNGLSSEDMTEVKKLHTGKRRFSLSRFKHFREYPFGEDLKR